MLQKIKILLLTILVGTGPVWCKTPSNEEPEKLAASWVADFSHYFKGTTTGKLLDVVDEDKKESVRSYLTTCLTHYAQYAHVAKNPQKLPSMMKKVAENEKKYASTHYAFYHGTNTFIVFIQDVIRVLMKTLENKNLPDDLAPLRIPYKDFEKYQTVQDVRGKTNDCNGDSRKIWLAVSPTPFSGIVPGSYSEGPATYFYNPVSKPGGGAILLCGGLNYDEILLSIFQYFGIEPLFNKPIGKLIRKEIDAIYNQTKNNPVAAYHNQYEGWLLQIFIPQKIAPIYASPSFLRGDLYPTNLDAENFFKQYYQDPATTVYPLTEPKYKNRSKAWHASYVQSRILLHPKVFLDSTSGVKVFRHRILPRTKAIETRYWQWLKSWAKKINAEKKALLTNNTSMHGQQTNIKNNAALHPSTESWMSAFYMDKSEQKKQRRIVLRDLSLYTTLPNGLHAGNLIDHVVWTARVIEQWFVQKYFWVNEISPDQREKMHNDMIIGAFFHDIGKAGDLLYCYIAKPNHRAIGFDYLAGDRPYQIRKQQALNLSRLFSSHNQQALAAIIGRTHHELGLMIRQLQENGFFKEVTFDASTQKSFDTLFSAFCKNATHESRCIVYKQFIEKLASYAQHVGYNQGIVDRNLLVCVLAMGAADVKGTQLVYGNVPYLNDFFQTNFSEQCNTSIHHVPIDYYQKFGYETWGKLIFYEILDYFKTYKQTKNNDTQMVMKVA